MNQTAAKIIISGTKNEELAAINEYAEFSDPVLKNKGPVS